MPHCETDATSLSLELVRIACRLAGNDLFARAALARAMLNSVRELVDTSSDEPEVQSFMRDVLADDELLGDDAMNEPIRFH
jgi:hypothetical protein